MKINVVAEKNTAVVDAAACCCIVTGNIQRLSLPMVSACDRLFDFQKKKGYSDNVPRYEELYMGPYPH